MHTVLKFLVRLVLIAAALVFAASLALLAFVLLVLWGLRAVWCKLTGRPVNPFVMRINPRTGFGNIYRPSPTTGAAENPAKSKRLSTDDVTDVEAKDIGHRPR